MSRLSRTPSPATWSSVEPPPMSTTSDPGSTRPDPAQRQPRLLLAGQEERLEAVAPFDLAQECLTVLGVAERARADGERPLGAERLELAPILREHVPDTGDRDRKEAAALVDAFAELRDREPADDFAHVAVDIGDEQPGRVRAEIDCGDSHLLARREGRQAIERGAHVVDRGALDVEARLARLAAGPARRRAACRSRRRGSGGARSARRSG